MFKVGDRVIKYKAYTIDDGTDESGKYCMCGGGSNSVPLGTKGLVVSCEGEEKISVHFDNGVNWIVSPTELKLEKGDVKMIQSLKDYYKEHQDTVITIGLIVLLDHFLFGGALRQKIQDTVEKMLGHVEKRITDKTA